MISHDAMRMLEAELRDRLKAKDDEIERLQSCLYGQESTQALYDRIEQLADAMHEIQQWSQAYPVEVFPEPDWKRAREVLKAHGMMLDAISAGVMRRALISINGIATAALAMPVPEPPLEDDARDVDRRPGSEGERHDQGDDVDGHGRPPAP